MAKKKEVKTNAIRMVEARKIEHTTICYDVSDGLTDGISVARKAGEKPEQVFKTLVLEGRSKEHYVCCIPVEKHLNLKKAAACFGEKSIEMIKNKELLPLTGYIHGGCSPIGMKKQFKTAIDESAKTMEKIFVSGGRVGLQIEISPNDILKIVNGSYEDLT